MKTPLAPLFCYLEWDKKKKVQNTKCVSVQSAPIQNFQAKEMLFGKKILKQSRLLNFTEFCEENGISALGLLVLHFHLITSLQIVQNLQLPASS